ncbi:hypothetical protein [Streptomyces noursei]|uniref:hypothetical protein n=1 Tax=Streptomyces noursei TaxID=1971 RepID=UPI003815CE48
MQANTDIANPSLAEGASDEAVKFPLPVSYSGEELTRGSNKNNEGDKSMTYWYE